MGAGVVPPLGPSSPGTKAPPKSLHLTEETGDVCGLETGDVCGKGVSKIPSTPAPHRPAQVPEPQKANFQASGPESSIH